MEATLKERFLKTYANVPLGLRDGVILVIDKKLAENVTVKDSISWRAAWIEVDQDTEWGRVILQELKKLELI